MWEPRRLTIIWASTACYKDNFTSSFLYLYEQKILVRNRGPIIISLVIICVLKTNIHLWSRRDILNSLKTAYVWRHYLFSFYKILTVVKNYDCKYLVGKHLLPPHLLFVNLNAAGSGWDLTTNICVDSCEFLSSRNLLENLITPKTSCSMFLRISESIFQWINSQ
jgi:hypothetical protein